MRSNGISVMKMDKEFPERLRDVFENDFLNFYFLNVDISLIIHDPNLKVFTCIDNIAVEGTVSQICNIGPDSVFMKF